ncbi:cobalt transporter CbiM [Pseudodesulfovibrio senegalensis]|jgi:cobalt/nickel transport system permease protein|uniref:Cobalt transporter CbiM n=1 Tax=Pseudodesulfovibrio senegalensis TaxID=1721087 RepID=A0A6N6N4M6_9BACT|nr:cobalt transporter CbiM [Pseudodesulfovibrio senegalensis]KAB1442164.1 cobalt transporter CbiM [Pseudodesulfovibrio senegalensis]
MHISEGVLAAPVLLSGAALTVVGTAVGLRRMDYDRIMGVAILSAAFFVASLVHVPVGPSSAHLILNGLLGLVLGWAAFPSILVALLLQAVLFQYGGLTVLGLNTFTMAAPAVLCYYLFRPLLRNGKAAVGAFLVGFCSVLLSALFAASALALSGEAFVPLAAGLVAAHIPIMVVEGFITMFAYSFLARVKPEVLQGITA